MTGVPELPYLWQRVLGEYAAGLLDAQDLWNAIDGFAAGLEPEPGELPVHAPDIVDAEDAALVQEQAARLAGLLASFVAGTLSGDDLAAEALEVLGLVDDPDDAAD